MSLYPKKLRSLEDLKREREVMKFARDQTMASDYFPSLPFVFPGSKSGDSGGVLPLVGDLLSSKSRLEKALSIAKPIIKLFARRKAKPAVAAYPAPEKKKNFFTSFLFELFGSYLALKLLSFAISAVSKKKK